MYNLERGPEPGRLFHDKGRGNGYIVTAGETRIYLSGDTECTPEMRALADIDLAFVCMNLPYTMTPAEAGACVDAFKPKVLYPYHYRDSDLGELERALAGSGVELRLRSWY
jgi:L-ascorbate metabolism protein UlaG (beta-lactamase superfamily)